MDQQTTTTDPAIDLRPQAVTAVRQAQTDRPDNPKLWAVKLLRGATGCYLGDGARAVEWAIAHLAAMRLDEHRVPTTQGWRYEFPNGHDASVINDPHRLFRFEILSDALNAPGGQVVGLTSEQVEAKLHTIAALPAN
ncbi:hypothetical protein AB0K35_27835 [Micromonospora sp. NPDC053740]|uniref:hypothetical protein n=1 Tax=Micromonospora sp. NPDC053740 TaxID=3155173 RepID=UPI00343D8D26